MGETKVSTQGAVCAASTGTGGGGTTGGGTNTARPCTPGATYEQSKNLCVVLVTLKGGKTQRIVVGKPTFGPGSGRVVALSALPKAVRRSKCAKGKGVKYAIIGTNGRDKITGTNGSDRIITLGGKDRVSGGRGRDCIDGGSGGGSPTGDQDNDRIYGGSSRESIKGGAGNDKIYAGKGNDRITTDFGKDFVDAGPGSDRINSATNGPAARGTCGSGKDQLTINKNEMRSFKKCERVRVVGSKS